MSKYLFDMLDNCHVEFDEQADYQIYEVNARQLLTFQRFDLYGNLIYIDHKVRGLDLEYATHIYRKRTEAITGYKLSEPGNDHKNDFHAYIDTFNKLIDSVQEFGFDPSISLVPIDKNNILIDGAHRVSCAAYFGQKVTVAKFYSDFQKDLTFSSAICKERIYAPDVWDAMALEYCKWHDDTYVIFFWPKTYKSPKMTDAINEIQKSVNIVFHKRLKLHYKGIRNLILQIYHHVPWMGTIDNGFKWSWTKTDEVYAPNGNVEIYLVKADGLGRITELKQRLRDIFDIGFESVHSTDNQKETLLAANILFNPNSIHLMENGLPDKYPHTFQLLSEYKMRIENANVNIADYIVDSSITMGLYGIRDAGDLDYLTTAIDLPIENNSKAIENHSKAIENHSKAIADLIFNPSNYFVFNGLKIISLKNLKEFKENRGSDKDKRDVALIRPFMKERGLKINNMLMLLDSKRRIYGLILKKRCIQFIVSILRVLGLYYAVRWCYRKFKTK